MESISKALTDEVRNLYNTLSAQAKDVLPSFEDGRPANSLRREILDTFHHLQTCVRDSGLETTKNYENVIAVAHNGDVDKLIELKSVNKPLKAGKSKTDKAQVEEWNTRFKPILDQFNSLSAEYIVQQAYQYYLPYVEAQKVISWAPSSILCGATAR